MSRTKLKSLNEIEERLENLIYFMRLLYPNFNSVRNAGEIINYLVLANSWLARLQDEEDRANKTDGEE